MADSPPEADTSGYTGVGPGRGSTTGTPRWVKVFGIIALVLVLLVGILFLAGGSNHGPGRHTPSDDAGGQAPPSSATEPGGVRGHQPRARGHGP